MPIQPPQTPAPMKPIPTPEDPPSMQDITNAINYADNVKIGYQTSRPGCPTTEDLANAYVYQSSVISARAGSDTPPPWFDAALAKALKPLEQKVDEVKTELGKVKVELRETSRTTNETYNLQCGTGEFRPYKIVRFLDGSSPPNDHPRLRALYTAQDIRSLSVREVKTYLDGYGLPSDSDNPKQAIANAIGCSAVL